MNKVIHADIEQKKKMMIKKRRKNRAKRRLLIFLFVAVCAAIMLVVFKAPFFDIAEVICEGNSALTEKEIFDIAQLNVGENIFSAGVQSAEERLEEHPQIAVADVQRVFPNKVKIKITEAVPVAYVEHEGVFLLADRQGWIIKTLDGSENGAVEKLVRMQGFTVVNNEPGKRLSADGDTRAEKLYECLEILKKADMLNKITFIDFSDLSDLKLDYENRLFILLGSYDNIEYKVNFIKKVISENISDYERSLFDYRTDRLYVRPRDEVESEEDTTEQDTEENQTPPSATENSDSSSVNSDENTEDGIGEEVQSE